MSKVAIETNAPVAKTATPASTATAHSVVAVIAKGEATENAAKKKRQGVLTQRAACTVALAELNTGKTHYGLNRAVLGALDKAVDDGAISKRLVTQLCKVIKSEHVVRVVSEGDDIAAIKTAMNIADDKPLTWRALLDFADNGKPAAPIDPADSMIEAWLNMEKEPAEKVLAFFKTQID